LVQDTNALLQERRNQQCDTATLTHDV